MNKPKKGKLSHNFSCFVAITAAACVLAKSKPGSRRAKKAKAALAQIAKEI